VHLARQGEASPCGSQLGACETDAFSKLCAARQRTETDSGADTTTPRDLRSVTQEAYRPRPSGALGRGRTEGDDQSLMKVTRDQIRGKLTFSTEMGLSAACARKPGRSRSDLNPMWTVKGEMARSIFASNGLGLRK